MCVGGGRVEAAWSSALTTRPPWKLLLGDPSCPLVKHWVWSMFPAGIPQFPYRTDKIEFTLWYWEKAESKKSSPTPIYVPVKAYCPAVHYHIPCMM